jgi:hypothetical protein
VIDEVAEFPAGNHDDYVDTVSMAMHRFRKGGYITTNLDEPDDIVRYKKLLNSIEFTVKHLKSLSRGQQIAWRFKELDLLDYNREVFMKRENTRKQLEVFSNKLTSIFQTKS